MTRARDRGLLLSECESQSASHPIEPLALFTAQKPTIRLLYYIDMYMFTFQAVDVYGG